MFRSLLLLAAGIAACFTQSGCALIDAGRSMTASTWNALKPRPFDYRDTSDEEDDDWAFVGHEGRGNRPLTDENDALKPLLMSKRAQSIERNLGYK